MKNTEVMTSGMVAKICRVASRTVNKWCDSGKLKHYKIGADRRIFRKDLVAFMEVHGIPLELLKSLNTDEKAAELVNDFMEWWRDKVNKGQASGMSSLERMAIEIFAEWALERRGVECVTIRESDDASPVT